MTRLPRSLLLAVGLGVFALLGLLAHLTIDRLLEESGRAARLHEILEALASLEASLNGAESARRGLALAEEPEEQVRFRAMLAAVEADVERLRVLLRGDAVQTGRLDRLQPFVEARRRQMLATRELGLREPGNAAAQAQAVAAGTAAGRVLRALLDEMAEEERGRLAAQDERSRQSARRTIGVLAAGTFLGLLLLAWVSVLLLREIRQRRKSEAALDDLYRRAPCGYHTLDLEGRFLEVNDTELGWLGRTREELVGRLSFGALLLPESAERFGRLLARLREGGGTADLEIEVLRRDGSRGSALLGCTALRGVDGRPVAVRCSLFDVTERKRAQLELGKFFQASLDLMAVASLAEGKFQRVSPSWEKSFGWTSEELCSRPWLDFVHPDDVAATVAEAGKQLEGAAVLQFENRYRRKDGTYAWLSWRVPRVEPGSTTVYAVARDVTEIRRLNERLSQQVAEVSAANRELEAFSYSVSHDLRAPLRHVSGFVELLQGHLGGSLDEKGERYLRTIADSAKRMGRLVDDLLSFSRLGRVELRRGRVDLDRLLDEARRELPSAPEVLWTVEPLPAVDGDPALLKQMLLNLLSNALKYSRNARPARIEVGCAERNGTTATVFVKDNGAGFDMQYAGKLFGVFQRLHRADEFEGTGVGLANVQRVVQRHGGAVRAEGKVGEGATFYVTLPLAREE